MLHVRYQDNFQCVECGKTIDVSPHPPETLDKFGEECVSHQCECGEEYVVYKPQK